MRKKIILIGVLSLHNILFGQIEVSKFSLHQCKEYALNHSEKIKNATIELEIAKQKVNETRSIGLPQINANGGFNNFLNLPVQVVSANFMNPNAKPGDLVAFKAGTDYSTSANIQVTQLIFNGSYIVGLQVSKFYTQFRNTTLKKTKEDVLFNVTQAYQTFVAAKTNLNFIDSIVSITENLVSKQRNYLELGLMTQEDMDQLEFALLTAKNNQSDANLQVKNAKALLKLTMGYPQEKDIETTETIEELLSKSAINREPFNLKNNLNYQLLSEQKALNEYALKEKKYSALPSLSAVAQHGYNAYRNDFNFFDAHKSWYSQTFWGLNLKVPIFSSGNQPARLKQAKLEIKKNENSLQELSETLKFQEQQAQNNLSSAKEQVLLQQTNIDLAKKIYENAVIKEQIGKVNSILVSQKYNQLIQSQAQYIGSILNLFNAQLQIDQLYNTLNK
jgi:outer membrane protein